MANKMITLKVKDWDELYRLASWFLSSEGRWVFRGQTKAEWGLKTTLERESDKYKGKVKVKKQFGTLEDFLSSHARSNEKEQIETFKAKVQWDHYMGEHLLPYLAAMQHYGLPTRLLDFTYSLFIAAYFAFENRRPRCDRAIWAIRLDPLLDHVRDTFARKEEAEGYKIERQILDIADGLIDPERRRTSVRYGVLPLLSASTNPRLKAQNGLFLMPFSIDGFYANLEKSLPEGLVAEPYYTERGEPCNCMSLADYMAFRSKNKIAIMKIVCLANMKRNAERVFQQMNLTPERIFPDMAFADARSNINYRFWYK